MNFDLKGIQQQGLPTAKFGIGTTIGSILSAAIPWIFTIAGMLLLVYLIFGGLQLMLSAGEPKAAQAAKSHITNALVGFIIIFVAFWIVQLFGIILGLKGIGAIFS
jgi:type IV secretion system pilin